MSAEKELEMLKLAAGSQPMEISQEKVCECHVTLMPDHVTTCM